MVAMERLRVTQLEKKNKVQLFKRIDFEFSCGRLQKRWYLEPFFSIVTKRDLIPRRLH